MMKDAPIPAAAEGVFDFERAFRELEAPIHLACERVAVVAALTEHALEVGTSEGDTIRPSRTDRNAISHMVFETEAALNEVEVLWTSALDASWEAQSAAEEAARPLLDLIIEHQAKTIALEATVDAIDILPADRGPTFEADRARNDAAHTAERLALLQLLNYRPQSIEEQLRRLDYLLRTVWQERRLQEWEFDAFFASTMPVGWKLA